MNMSVKLPPEGEMAAEQASAASNSLLAVGVVIFNNSAAEIDEFVRALHRAIARLEESEARDAPANTSGVSIWLKNNGDMSPRVQAFGPNAKLSSSRENTGFARAHNLLMGKAFADGAQFYLALNPDAKLHPDALIEMIAVSRANGDRVLIEASQFPEDFAKAYNPLTLETAWAAGCCLFIPRIIYSTIGDFDENMFLYCEDVDFSWRARQAGFGVKIAPRALIDHVWNKPGGNRATVCEHLNAARYLGYKWGNEDFAREMEARLRAKGLEVRDLPEAMPRLSAPAITDFKHSLSFAAERWTTASAIPVHSLIHHAEHDNTIDVIVRFHDPAQMWRLSRCLFSLYAQRHQPIQVLLVLQGFDDAALGAVNECVDAFDWSAPRRRPILVNVAIPSTGDHRSLLWNAGVDASKSRYLGFCDFDDIIYSNGYGYLLHRLQFSGAAAAFASAFFVDSTPMHGFDFSFEKSFRPGQNRYDFLVRNFCPPNSVMLDRSKIETRDLYADVTLSKTEDRRVFVLIVSKYETDWASVGTVVSDYMHRTDGSNTVPSHRKDMASLREWEVAHSEEKKFLASLTMNVSLSDIIQMHSARLRSRELEDECRRIKQKVIELENERDQLKRSGS